MLRAKNLFLLLIMMLPWQVQAAGDAAARLQQILEPMVAALAADGIRVAVGVQGLSDGFHERVLVGSEAAYHPASIIKLLLIATLLQQVDEGLLSLDNQVEVGPETVVGGMGSLQHDTLPQQVTLARLAELTITISDNTATNVLVDVVGYEAMAALASQLGLDHTRFGRKMFEAAQPPLRDNFTTAADTLALLTQIYNGQFLTADSRARMLGWMQAQTVQSKIAAGIPAGVLLAHKTGENGPVSHDAGFVLSPGTEFVLVIFSESSTTSDFDTAQALLNPQIAALAAAVYAALNP